MGCDSLSDVSMSNGHDSWKVKVHPAFLKIRKLWSDFQKGDLSSGPDGATRNALELRAEVVRFRDELLKQYPDLRPGSPSNHILAASKRFLTERDEAVGALEWLCWRRTGQPLGVLLEEEKAGSLVAHENIQRVRDDYWRAAHGESVEPFKTSADHGELMEIGLNLGLTALSDEELAACFDDLCAKEAARKGVRSTQGGPREELTKDSSPAKVCRLWCPRPYSQGLSLDGKGDSLRGSIPTRRAARVFNLSKRQHSRCGNLAVLPARGTGSHAGGIWS